jgi:hypothetical protein
VPLIRGGFFSFTSGPASGDDDAYLRWHLLDHLPEQYSIAGLRLGTRWRADDACVASRAAAAPDLAPVRHAVAYLMAEPLEDTLREFAQLGRRLAEAGRYPEPATPHLLGAFEVRDVRASPEAIVSADALPFRAHRGVYLIVERPAGAAALDTWWAWHTEEHVPALLEVEGVAGVTTFVSTARLGDGPDQAARFGTAAPWDPDRGIVTVVYLDEAVDRAAARLDPVVRARWADGTVEPRLAGAFRSNVAYEAWPVEP